MIKSVLIAVDGSSSSSAALDTACTLAQAVKGRLLGLFVKDERRLIRFDFTGVVVGDTFIPANTSQMKIEHMKNAERCRAHTESAELYDLFEKRCEDAELRGDFSSEWGIAEQGIAEASRRADIVVLGNSGRHSGATFLKIGATANAVVHLTTCPVLIVPEEAHGMSQRIVIAFDGSPASQRTLRVGAEFAKLNGLDVDLLTVGDNGSEIHRIQEPAGDYLSAYGIKVTLLQRGGHPATAILDQVERSDARYLALGSFGPHHVMEKLFGSTTQEVLEKIKVSTLLVA